MANSSSGDSVVERVVRLIAAFPEGVTSLQLTELAERAGLPLSSAHRLVRQLSQQGLLDLGAGGTVRLGLRLWELVNRNSPTLALRQAAMPFMEDIQQVLNQNVNLAILEGWEALFVERLSRRGSVANRARVAGRMPVHISSAGLALMANQPRELQAEYLKHFRDPAGKVTADVVRHLLAEAAQQGYAQLAGVVDPDTWGIAVPILDSKRRTVAALGVVVPLAEMRLQALVPALQTAARGIGRQLGDNNHNFRSMEVM
ncbi:DNA-binding IclR family transcriptional regulator [Paenarthrobacter nicotinovorans]|uniref:DNA-binding IclR family transcriptional regulator n=1 Tax=Paenarthrobacter nicotinovorans TaxID=29320 RepID=A0ABT9TSI5_PAENI|nr:IclR family transcriptional regulator [Paenarthrobacter nicotinovorans]MBP2394775.1 DNA-binding IclR family transcriptional regulator [Paenarthrobacter nicotinovorans]MDQ0103407.1 DNA-binding IclR family transcriptional regulator [Paenarthrobacter nicotinovorans]UKE99054.1 IclR family transcriptional regulator [Paenarthrobacter nicotinovorans]UKF03834.1 IclR family transcriptional regulator [Paenarthrobacter nicotinovorans]GAT89880.1 IclR family transcriptional regulator [Paenarthrobacter n